MGFFNIIFSIAVYMFLQRLIKPSLDEPLITTISWSLLYTAFFMTYYVLGKIYCLEWKKISGNNILISFIEKVVVPVLSVFLVTDFNIFYSESNFLMIFAIYCMLVASDIAGGISGVVGDKFNAVNEKNIKMCYLKYPPDSRVDLLPMDAVFICFTVILFVDKYLPGGF